MTSVDALLLGRKTYQAFAHVWPTITGLQGLADRMNQMPKFVASRTLRKVEWNARLLQGDLSESLLELKSLPGEGLVVVGSRDLVRYLQRHDLVDEYRLWIHPVIVGAGSHLFDAGLDPSLWNLGDVESTKEGVVVLTYRRAGH
jgi:dihydrofolate reductase